MCRENVRFVWDIVQGIKIGEIIHPVRIAVWVIRHSATAGSWQSLRGVVWALVHTILSAGWRRVWRTGVERCFAIQAGREIRVMVNPENVSDQNMSEMSEQIARRLEEELQYPGQIKITVVREMRATEIAR